MQEADGSTIEAPKIENPEKENAATINIPTGGTEENTKIAAVVFEEAREAIEKYVGGKKGYKKNKYKYDDRTVQLVEANWDFALKQWGYSL